MKRLILLSLLLGLIPSVKADSYCTLKSDVEPDISLEMYRPIAGRGVGTLNYQNKPEYFLQIGISNGYGGQYYVIRKLAKDIAYEDDKKSVASGKVVGMIGTQTRTTPKDKRKSGVKRIMFPNFGTGYYYSLSNYFEPEKDGRFAGRTKAMSAILGASEGFFIPDKACERFIFYGWD